MPKGDRASKAERLFAKVNAPPGCWEWSGTRNQDGYGVLRTGPRGQSKLEFAHRLMWELIHGPFLVGSVLHHCDNPPCVRPDHLYLGTPRENALDREVRQRSKTRLTVESVRIARQLYAQGWTNHQLARAFGVTDPTMHAVVHNRAWKHVD